MTATPRTEVAIIGAGFGGLGMAIRLKRAGINDFVLIEHAETVGGTWRDNTYPGCACDIPSHLYSFSFAPSADWSRRYPMQSEIQDYLEACVEQFGLRPHLRLGCALREATFDNGVWRLRTDPDAELSARVLVLAQGALHRPAIPALAGLETFTGARFHSSRWDHRLDLTGKRVAVIGTGASAIQFVPRIAASVASLALFQRTPPWILPKRDPPSTPRQRWVLRHVLLARRAFRAWLYWTHEMRAVGFVMFPSLLRAAERQARSHAKRSLNDDLLRERLTPDYRIGCKRILLSNDFLPSLNNANVSVVAEPIKLVQPDGVLTADGVAHQADVLIFATGFQATDPLGSMRITGRDGITLESAWKDGMQAHLGLTVAGFPNLFLLGGPNTGLGHNSIVFMLEAQIGHVLRCVRLLRRRRAVSMDVRRDAQDRFNQQLDGWMRRTVWLSGCRSWYLDRNGRNTTLWPGFSVGYWWRVRAVSERVYRLTGVDGQRR
jgi:cation diffusion facilitator CzcD-associated flavoprotein CzcO